MQKFPARHQESYRSTRQCLARYLRRARHRTRRSGARLAAGEPGARAQRLDGRAREHAAAARGLAGRAAARRRGVPAARARPGAPDARDSPAGRDLSSTAADTIRSQKRLLQDTHRTGSVFAPASSFTLHWGVGRGQLLGGRGPRCGGCAGRVALGHLAFL